MNAAGQNLGATLGMPECNIDWSFCSLKTSHSNSRRSAYPPAYRCGPLSLSERDPQW